VAFSRGRFKNNYLTPQPDIQGADFAGQELMDHRWLDDGSNIVVVSRQGKLWIVDPSRSRQHIEVRISIDIHS